MKPNNHKILALESLRGLAALSVVIYHAGGSSMITENMFIRHAYLMVDFFFVLSGYVIALNYFGKINNFEALLKFQMKRFWRLYPLHFALLSVFLSIEIAKYLFQQQTGIIANNPAFSINDGWAFAANLALTHGLFLDQPTFNIPSWSISAEFWTYLIFGLLVLLPRKAILVPAVAVACFFFFAFYNDGKIADNFHLTLLRCVLSFFTGAFIHIAIRNRQIDFPVLAQPIVLFAATLSVVTFADTGFEILLPLIFGLVVLVFSSGQERLTARILSVKPLVYLGTISYSIYMTHSMVWWATDQFYRFVLKFPTATSESGSVYVILPPETQLVFQGVQLALTVLVSHITYKLIEVPFQRGLPAKITPEEKSLSNP